MKLKGLLILIFLNAGFVFCQNAKDKKQTKIKQETFLKPTTYDSTKTLAEQFQTANQYQFIGLQLFLPPVLNAELGPVIFSKVEGIENGNKYYTVIDILPENNTATVKQKKLINTCGSKFKDLDSPMWKETIIYKIFVLRENSKKDTLYWVICQSKVAPHCNSHFNSFVAVPYFEKQKQIFQDQNVVYLKDKSKWVCKDVTYSRTKNDDAPDSVYTVVCKLANDKGEQIQQRPPSEKYGRTFITAKEYDWLDHANRNEKMQMQKEESDRKKKYLAYCADKFGARFGPLIAQNKIETGMTPEMCKQAWGEPWEILKTENIAGPKEAWNYNWKYTLHFRNKVLVKVEH